jgi:hypothetical protein
MRDAKLIGEQLGSRYVPQADDLETVFRVVELTAAGVELTPLLLGIVERQIDYYSHAAKVLGFLDKDGEPTPIGRRCLALRGTERLSCAAAQFERSTCGAAWMRWARKSTLAAVPAESAEQFLMSATELAETTARRRAMTLRAWAEKLWPRSARTRQGASPRMHR